MKKTVGIPKALLFYYYKDLWKAFFEKLDVEVIYSDDTNKEILEKGERISIDEACKALKIYIGHIDNLKGRCDYILVPRMYCVKKGEQVCTNFNALFDIVHNLYPDINILNYNIDLEKRKKESKAFIHMGEQLGFSYIESYNAYLCAKEIERKKKEEKIKEQEKKFSSNNLKVLVASHPYNLYDSYISGQIIQHLEKEKIDIIYSDLIQPEIINRECEKISTDIHWSHSKEVMAGIKRYEKKVDGMILISSFPCGPDSLAVEMIKRKVDLPTLYLVFENENSGAGITTRLESFFDILKAKKEAYHERSH